MTLLLRHSSGAQALGAEFPVLGHASSVVCSVLLRDVCAAQWSLAHRALGLTPRALHSPMAQGGTVWRHGFFPEKMQL